MCSSLSQAGTWCGSWGTGEGPGLQEGQTLEERCGCPPPMVLPEYPLERPSRQEPSRACTASSVTPESSGLLRPHSPSPQDADPWCTSHPLKAACGAAQASVCPAPATPCSQSRQDCLLKQAWEPRLCRVPPVWPLASFPPCCASVSLCVTRSVRICFRNCWEGRSGIAGDTDPVSPQAPVAVPVRPFYQERGLSLEFPCGLGAPSGRRQHEPRVRMHIS